MTICLTVLPWEEVLRHKYNKVHYASGYRAARKISSDFLLWQKHSPCTTPRIGEKVYKIGFLLDLGPQRFQCYR